MCQVLEVPHLARAKLIPMDKMQQDKYKTEAEQNKQTKGI